MHLYLIKAHVSLQKEHASHASEKQATNCKRKAGNNTSSSIFIGTFTIRVLLRGFIIFLTVIVIATAASIAATGRSSRGAARSLGGEGSHGDSGLFQAYRTVMLICGLDEFAAAALCHITQNISLGVNTEILHVSCIRALNAVHGEVINC